MLQCAIRLCLLYLLAIHRNKDELSQLEAQQLQGRTGYVQPMKEEDLQAQRLHLLRTTMKTFCDTLGGQQGNSKQRDFAGKAPS